MQHQTPDASTILRLACALLCDKRTVRRYFDDRPMTCSMTARIEQALDDLGLSHLKKRPPMHA
jgi:hypothetical protein